MARRRVGDERTETLGKALTAMFKSLQSRPVPSRLRSVVDQLDDDAPSEPLKKSG
jgi:hypothetical protein